jgi:hypothetical protein
MIKVMKLLTITSGLLLLFFTCACKLEPSSATANRNANVNANAPADASSSNQEAKANCPLRIAVVPVLHGLKLGMSPDEVLAVFPGAKEDPDLKPLLSRAPSQFGATELVIHPQKYEWKDKFPGIDHINFTFLDGHAHTINIGYTGPAYSHVDEFVNKFVAGSTLPAADQWQAYPGLDTQMKTLTCQDFEVRIYAGGEGGNQNYVLLRDLEAEKTLKDRRAKARAQASPKSSP